jgi:predicted metal-dependent peptidase
MKLTAEQRLSRAHFQVVNHVKHCAIGGVVMFGQTSIDETFPTAYTDGFVTKYGRTFVGNMDDPELRFVVLHENYHKAFRHLTTWMHLYKDDPELANIACDHVINLKLIDLDAGEGFIKMPSKHPGCADPKFKGMDSGQVFRLLKEAQEQGGGGQGQGDGEGQGEGQGFDEHGWEDASTMTEQQQQAIAAQIDQALRQGAILAGKRGGNIDRSLAELLEPKVNWREVLREFVTTQCAGRDASSWRRVNRRFVGSGLYLPGTISESVGRLLVGVDTSGSIGGPELQAFMAEVVGVAKQVQPEVLDLVYWDSKVAAHEKYGVHELDGLETKTKPKGGGGTSPSCVTSHMREHNIKPECAVILTDGHVGGDWGGSWPCPVLFVICGGNRVIAPVGKTVHI